MNVSGAELNRHVYQIATSSTDYGVIEYGRGRPSTHPDEP